MMSSSEGETRMVATCANCGSVYAALELTTGEIQPIGSRRGCATCGETTFTPLS